MTAPSAILGDLNALGVPLARKDALNNTVAMSVGDDIFPLAATAYELAPASLRITASQIVVGKSAKLMSVKCIVGAAIALTIYDNQTLPAGTVLFAQTMSAGDEALVPNGSQAINGLTANFTGTATFDIGVQDAS